jgi:hypothetical protein
MSDKQEMPKQSCTTQKVNLKNQQQGQGKTTESKGPRKRAQS